MQKSCPYGFGKTVALSYDCSLAKLIALFHARGFSILFQIDMQEALRVGGADFRRYMIIGACHPRLASRAFGADPDIGLLLPCNVIVYEEEAGKSTIMAMDPVHVMDLVRIPEAIEVAIEIKEELEELMELL